MLVVFLETLWQYIRISVPLKYVEKHNMHKTVLETLLVEIHPYLYKNFWYTSLTRYRFLTLPRRRVSAPWSSLSTAHKGWREGPRGKDVSHPASEGIDRASLYSSADALSPGWCSLPALLSFGRTGAYNPW